MSWFESTPESDALLVEERLVLAATEVVHDAMVAAGVNRQELAEMLNVKPSEISQRLSGRRNLTLRSLAQMLWALKREANITLKDDRAEPEAAAPMEESVSTQEGDANDDSARYSSLCQFQGRVATYTLTHAPREAHPFDSGFSVWVAAQHLVDARVHYSPIGHIRADIAQWHSTEPTDDTCHSVSCR